MLNYFNMLLRNALRGYLSFNYRFNVMAGTRVICYLRYLATEPPSLAI